MTGFTFSPLMTNVYHQAHHHTAGWHRYQQVNYLTHCDMNHVTLTKAWFWNLVWLWGGRVRQRCHVSFGSRASTEIGLQLGQACCASAGIGRGLVFISAVSSVIHFSSILIYLALYFSALLLLLSLFSFNKTKTTKYDSDCLSFPWSIST